MHQILILIHVTAGGLGLLSGAAALSFSKGSRLHRTAGNVFFVSMLIMAALGAFMALFAPAMLTVLTGLLAFYLVATAWVTVRRKEGAVGIFDYGAFLLILAVAVAQLTFGMEAANSESGLKDGFPAVAYFIFGSVALVAAALDGRLIICGGVFGRHRIARHLWRMCFALYIATASLFLGQPQVFPEAIRGTLILSAPVIATVVLMIFWLVRVLFTKWYRTGPKRLA